MSDQQNSVDRPAWHEELRFAKKQQWYVATSAVTLLAAIFAIARGTLLSDDEKGIASILILLIASFGILFLCKLQHHLKEVRKKLNPGDSGAWVRGSDILFVLAGIIGLSAVLVFYFLWVPHVAVAAATPNLLTASGASGATLGATRQTMSTFFSLHPFVTALLASVVLGIPVTFLWSELLHYCFLPSDPSPRGRWPSMIFGVLERALLTTLILWLPIAAGGFVGAWLIVKAILGWADLGGPNAITRHEGRIRYSVALFGNMASILWAVGWGIWGMPPPHSNC